MNNIHNQLKKLKYDIKMKNFKNIINIKIKTDFKIFIKFFKNL